MKLPDWLDNVLNYINDNMLLIMKAIIAGIILLVGPFAAVGLRMNGASIGSIIGAGMVLEIVGAVIFIVLIKKEYLMDEIPKPESNAPKKKGKRSVPEEI